MKKAPACPPSTPLTEAICLPNFPEATSRRYDPDAPTGSGWWHWVALDIPSNVTTLAEGAKLAAPARELTTDYGTKGFGGACPPSGHGMHRYVFTVWALPVEKLDLPDGATAANAGFMLNAMALATAKITATYVTP